jgi:hypothetical protein
MDVRASHDTLIDIFERIENFFQRLEIYTEVSPTPEMMDIIVKIMGGAFYSWDCYEGDQARKAVRVSNSCKSMSLSTEKMLGKYLKKLVGRTDMEDALKKLDKLTNEEARMATAQVLKATRTVEDKVLDVDNRVAGVDDSVASVDDKVKAVDDKVAVVMDGAQLPLISHQ